MRISDGYRTILAGICGTVVAATVLHATLTTTDGTTTSTAATNSRIHQPLVDPVLAAQMAEVEKLPTIEADTVPRYSAVAYYSAQNLLWPPLPANFFGLPMWDLGDGQYLINDLAWDYSTPTTTALALSSSVMALDSGGGVVTMNDLIQSGVPYLTFVPTNANQALITVFNDTSPANYELWFTPVLGDTAGYPWTAVAVGATGQTNFTVNVGVYPTGFYRAVQDTNDIPLWQAADPNNQATGVLNVWIDTPANGTALN